MLGRQQLGRSCVPFSRSKDGRLFLYGFTDTFSVLLVINRSMLYLRKPPSFSSKCLTMVGAIRYLTTDHVCETDFNLDQLINH